MEKRKKKSHFIFISKVYRLTTIALLVSILVLGVLYKNVSGQNKCVETKVVKKEIINPNVVFFGDSITDYYNLDKYYPNLKKVNSGISGNRTWDLKKDMYNRVYRYNPSKVILLIGINNFLYENSSAEFVMKDIEEIINEMHKNLPNCEILVQSIYPINDEWKLHHRNDVPTDDILINKIIETNMKIKNYCEKNNYKFIDMFEILSDDNCRFNEEYTDDGLHPNEKGYEVITKELKKYI